MKKLSLIISSLICLFALQAFAIDYTWNGSANSNWSNSANWTPAGVPGSADNVTLNIANTILVDAGNTTITNLTMSDGVINFNGDTLTILGLIDIENATLKNGVFYGSTSSTVAVANSTISSTYSGTFGNSTITNNTFQSNTNISAGTITVTQNKFSGPTTLYKNGASGLYSSSNNYSDSLFVTQTSVGYGSSYLSYTGPDTITGFLRVINQSVYHMYISYSYDNTYKDIEIEGTSSGDILFGKNGGKTVVPTGYELRESTIGITSSSVLLELVNVTLGEPCSLVIAGSLTIDSCKFMGNTILNTGTINITQTQFDKPTVITKNGASGFYSSSNKYSDSLFVTQTSLGYGSSYLSHAGPDTINGFLRIINQSVYHVYISHSYDNIYKDIELEATSSGDIIFGGNGGKTVVPSGYELRESAIGMTNTGAQLVLEDVALSEPCTLIIAGTLTIDSCKFMDNTILNTGTINITQTQFDKPTSITKNGSAAFYSSSNKYSDSLIVTQTSLGSGSSYLSHAGPDTISNFLRIINQSVYHMYVSYSYDNTYKDIEVEAISSGDIIFGKNGGKTVIPAGYELRETTTGMTSTGAGLELQDVTISEPCTLIIAGTLKIDSSKFMSKTTLATGTITITQTQFDKPTSITKDGASGFFSSGNKYSDSLVVTHTAAGYGSCYLSYAGQDTINGDLRLINQNAGHIYVSHSYDNTYKNVGLEITATGDVYFGNNGGNTVFSSGYTLTEINTGVTNRTGNIYVYNGQFIAPFNIDIASSLYTYDCDFMSNTSITALGVFPTRTTFNESTRFSQVGINALTNSVDSKYMDSLFINSYSTGGNYMYFSKDGADTMMSYVLVNNSSANSGQIHLAHTQNQTFANNIDIRSNTGGLVYFGHSGGVATFPASTYLREDTGGISSTILHLYNIVHEEDFEMLGSDVSVFYINDCEFKKNTAIQARQMIPVRNTFTNSTTIT